MIDLVTKQDVILKVEVEGLSQRSVATKLGISRNTVKKYIQEYRNAREKFTDLSVENFALTEDILEKPSYNTEKRAKRKLTEGMMDRLDFYIKQNIQKRTDGRRKQQMKIIDMHEALLEQGFDIGYTKQCGTTFGKRKRLEKKPSYGPSMNPGSSVKSTGER